tara:strand:+ start:24430 stop:24786 length:357 start_codon:yes stop_codon:yes gene_type:complete
VDMKKLQKRLSVLSEFDTIQSDRIIEYRVSKIIDKIDDDVPVKTSKLRQGVDSYKEVNGTVIEAIAISESEDYGAALEVSGFKAKDPARKIPFFYPNIEEGGIDLINDFKKAIKKVLK